MKPSLSICCITFNQENFIEQALKSFFEQKANFEIELIISDDSSTDQTLAIIEKYQTLWKGKLRVLKNARNLGVVPNFIQALNACTSKYIAICEGDDYWCDQNKLQKQVDFLESNSEFAICFHRVYLTQEGKELELSDLNTSSSEETYNINDLAKRNMIHTPSVVFRNGLIESFPEWFPKSPVGDYVLHMLNAKKGLIKYLPDVMAVYRLNSGIWSSQKRQVMLKKWLQVLSFLLTENFDRDVISSIQHNWRNDANAYLHILFADNLEKFTSEFKILANEDESLAYEWATSIYPDFIKTIFNSRSYKLAKKMSMLVNKFRKI